MAEHEKKVSGDDGLSTKSDTVKIRPYKSKIPYREFQHEPGFCGYCKGGLHTHFDGNPDAFIVFETEGKTGLVIVRPVFLLGTMIGVSCDTIDKDDAEEILKHSYEGTN